MMAGEKVQYQMRIRRGLDFSLVFLNRFGKVSSTELGNSGASKMNGEIFTFLREESDEPVFGRKLVGALDGAIGEASIGRARLSVDNISKRGAMTIVHMAAAEEPPAVLEDRPTHVGAGIHGVQNQVWRGVALRSKERRQVIAFEILILVVGLRSTVVCIS